MRPWNTASAKSSKTMRQRFPTKRGNGFNIRRLGGCFIILLASTCCVRQANGRLSSISPRSISTCFASLGHRTCGFMTSEIRKNHRGGAECRFIVVTAPGLTFLAPSAGLTIQWLGAAVFRLSLLAGRMIEVVGFDCALQPTIHLIGQGSIAQPPAPAVAGTDMDPQLSGDATG